MATEQDSIREDERVFVRVPFQAEVAYSYGNGQSGLATCDDVSRGGMSVRMGRYLRPGRLVLVTVNHEGEALELKARVAWCRPEKGGEQFRVGFHVFHDEPDTFEVMSQLMHEAAFAVAMQRPLTIEERRPLWKRICGCIPKGGIAASLGLCLTALLAL